MEEPEPEDLATPLLIALLLQPLPGKGPWDLLQRHPASMLTTRPLSPGDTGGAGLLSQAQLMALPQSLLIWGQLETGGCFGETRVLRAVPAHGLRACAGGKTPG